MALSQSRHRTLKSMASVWKGLALLPSKMATDMKAIFITDYSVARESLLGLMESFTRENLQITESQEKAFTCGLMEVDMKDKSKMAFDMDLAFTRLMMLHTRETGSRGKKKGKEK